MNKRTTTISKVRLSDNTYALVTLVSISELARIIGKSTDTVRRYEREGIFQRCFFKNSRGDRLYPENFAKQLKPLVEKIPRHTTCPIDVKTEILNLFNEERSKYAGA